jgi:hypothetical protein
MPTSLDVQAIDSKVDIFTEKQDSSQRVAIGHLEKIQERVQIFETLQHANHGTTLNISRSTDKIEETLHEIRVSQTSSQQTTRLQVEKLDATLSAIQRSLLSLATKERPRSRGRRNGKRIRHSSPIKGCGEWEDDSMPEFSELVQQTVSPAEIPAQVNRLVDLAVTVRYRCGKAHFEALAVPDPEFESADFEAKLRMVKYLQDLRLLLWLLCRKEYVYNRCFTSASLS